MIRRSWWVLTLGCCLLLPFNFLPAFAAPNITNLSINSGAVGTPVTITGTGFGTTQGSNTVTFNGKAATVSSWSGGSIAVTVPVGATTGNVVVHVGSQASNGVLFTVTPAITGLSKASGPEGTAVTITGTTFGQAQGSSTVTFNGTAATIATWSATSIGVAVPSGATTGNVVVTVGGNASNGITFTVTPAIISLSISAAPVSTSVTITGTTFGATQGSSTVTFNGRSATVSNWGTSSVTVKVPAGATTGNVVVTVGGHASNGVLFTVTPAIVSLSIAQGPVGTAVTITGTTFGQTQGSSTVTFNGTAATAAPWSATSIGVTVPTGATTGNVVVTVGGHPSNGVPFTVTGNAPTITSLNSNSAPAGALVQVIGQNLSVAGQQTVVNLGSVQITGNQVTSSDPTSVYFLVPSGAMSGNLSVQVGGQSSNSIPFTVLTPPQVYTLAPMEVVPSGVLTISGIYFGASGANGSSLLIDGQPATTSAWTNTQITAQAPSVSGTHTLAVVAGGSQSASVQFVVLSYGTISGTITSSGSPVPGATVQGVAGQSAVTNSGGSFSFTSVPVGTYSLGAVAPGYVPSVVGQVAVASGSNTNVQIQIALPSPTQISIVPSGPTVTVGGGQNLSLVDQNGMPVTGATWSVDDSTIAFIDTTDNSVTGVAVGTTTIRAVWQGYQASTPLIVIPAANVLWSSQLSSQQEGSALPLAKTGTGPDFVYTDGSNLYGVSYDNGVLWQQSLQGLPTLTFSQGAGDENGDFVIPGRDPASYNATMTKFYGTNGLPEWTRELAASVEFGPFAVDSQGDVFAVIFNGNLMSNTTSLQEFASSNGQIVSSQTMSDGTEYTGIPSPPYPGTVSVMSDGSVQEQYEAVICCAAYIVHLITSSATSANDVVLDTTVTGGNGGVEANLGVNLPDGNGGIVNIWEEDTVTETGSGDETTAATLFFHDSSTGVTFESNDVIYAGMPVLGSTGLLYFVGDQFGCPGYCGSVLVAMNLANSTEAWRIQLNSTSSGGWSGQPFGTPVAATSDGGVVVTAVGTEGYVSGAARIDINGNVTPDSDLSSYVENYFDAYPSPLTYLGGPDGTLWASSSSQTVVSELVDADDTDGDTVSDWGTPTGKANAFRAELKAHFKDASASLCGGFDGKPGPGKHAPAILVVPLNGSNQVILKIKGAWQNYSMTSDTSTVTFTPPAPTGNSTTFTINGGSTATLARLKVYNANGSRQATLRVAVKALKPTTLDLYPVTDPNNNLVGTAPSSANVSTELQSIFGKYANLSFIVNPMPTISMHYDLNSDGALQDSSGPGSESQAINTYIASNGGNPADIWVSYVKDINPHTVEGFTPVSQATHCGINAEYIRNNTDTSLNGQPWVTAHETGHELCLLHNTLDTNDLMTPMQSAGTGPCRLHEGEWHILNPTQGEDQPPSVSDQ